MKKTNINNHHDPITDLYDMVFGNETFGETVGILCIIFMLFLCIGLPLIALIQNW